MTTASDARAAATLALGRVAADAACKKDDFALGVAFTVGASAAVACVAFLRRPEGAFIAAVVGALATARQYVLWRRAERRFEGASAVMMRDMIDRNAELDAALTPRYVAHGWVCTDDGSVLVDADDRFEQRAYTKDAAITSAKAWLFAGPGRAVCVENTDTWEVVWPAPPGAPEVPNE